jgi:integrase/predicted RNA-binding Zn-ribbon protein involved in translation (DUF1610 family)
MKDVYSEKRVKNEGKFDKKRRPVQPPKCPECGSTSVWRDGWRKLRGGGGIQRYLCRLCGFRFSKKCLKSEVKVNIASQPFEGSDSGKGGACSSVGYRNLPTQDFLDNSSLSAGENIRSHDASMIGEALNSLCSYSRRHRVCVSDAEMKNLATVETRTENQAAGATKQSETLIKFAWDMQKQGYSENTIIRRIGLLRNLTKTGAHLYDPESVKEAIAKKDTWCNKTKELAVNAYTNFLNTHGGTWNPPRYMKIQKLPLLPLEREIDDLISGCNKKTAAFLQLLKETGMRCGEAWKLKWTDLDFENRNVNVIPEKGSRPRILSISNKCVAMLKGLAMNQTRVFPGSLRHFSRNFRKQRKRIACKLMNPRIKCIHFHSLRHFFATMDYHHNKDILRTMQKLGHRNIQNTLIYTQLVNFGENEWNVQVANNTDDACELVKVGFEYVTGEYKDGGKIFRKRK